jgi:UDP-3-O-[3-hydroxymyristoyl] N-acetylglucosamine deacetylase
MKSLPDVWQGTLACPVFFEGRGLHTGRRCRVAVRPAPADHGLIFQHIDRHDRTTAFPARWQNVRDLPLCTCLSDGASCQIRTVEHLLAACYASGIDNATIEVRGNEIPVLDGSAKPFLDAFASAGTTNQPAPRRVFRITRPLDVKDGPRWIKIEPNEGLSVELQTYVAPFGRLPWWKSAITRSGFARDIAPARTFGSLRDGLLAKAFTWLLPNPICLGATHRNAVVIFRGRVVTPGGLRYPDEFARHRTLDLIGDLMLGGGDFHAKFTCFSPTHRLTRKALEVIFGDQRNFEVVVRKDPEPAPPASSRP